MAFLSLALAIFKLTCPSLLGVARQLHSPLYCYCDHKAIWMSLLQSPTITFEPHQARQQSKIYVLTPHECVHCTRIPHLIWSRNNCPTGNWPHTSQRTTHISHFTPLTSPLRFTPTHLTRRASYRTPQIKKLIANTSFLFSHLAAQTHISLFAPRILLLDNTADNLFCHT